MDHVWHRCSSCKNEIGFGQKYWVCSVTSCSKMRAPVQFCSPDCWAVHTEIENHKSAWAVEHVAPRRAGPAAKESAPPSPAPRAPSRETPPLSARPERDVLVVVSRLKEFVFEKSNGMSTSGETVAPLSDHVRRMADAAIASAREHNRKTVLDRDLVRAQSTPDLKGDVLVVVSKLKEYVRAHSDLRTSDELPVAISEEIRRLCLFAIDSARRAGRKTVMARDLKK
jgi:histone H3/H4